MIALVAGLAQFCSRSRQTVAAAVAQSVSGSVVTGQRHRRSSSESLLLVLLLLLLLYVGYGEDEALQVLGGVADLLHCLDDGFQLGDEVFCGLLGVSESTEHETIREHLANGRNPT